MKKVISLTMSLFFILLISAPVSAEYNSSKKNEISINYFEKSVDNEIVVLKRTFETSPGNATTEVLDSWTDFPRTVPFIEESINTIPFNELTSVIGTDGRTVVSNTKILPYSAIVYLSIMRNGDPLPHRATGVLLSNNVVLTAGHCLYQSDTGWATSIQIVPGKNGVFNNPFGSSTAKSMQVSQDWHDNETMESDWGVIIFDNTFTGNPGFLEYTYAHESSFQGKISGYPAYVGSQILPKFRQYEMNGIIYNMEDYFSYTIDTGDGQSGAPILDEDNKVVGIHTTGGTTYNWGTIITFPLGLHLRMIINNTNDE